MGHDNPFNLTERQRKELGEVGGISPELAVHAAVYLWDEAYFMAEYPIPAAMKGLVRSSASHLREDTP